MRGIAYCVVTCDECGEEERVEIAEDFLGSLEDFVSSELRVWYDWSYGPEGDLCCQCKLKTDLEYTA